MSHEDSNNNTVPSRTDNRGNSNATGYYQPNWAHNQVQYTMAHAEQPAPYVGGFYQAYGPLSAIPPTSGPSNAPHGPYPPLPPGIGAVAPPVDPALVPLPEDDDSDFPPAHKILPNVAVPSTKIAGSRRPATATKGKGKQKASASANPTATKRKAATSEGNDKGDVKRIKRGRAVGTANYNEEDIDFLLDLLEEYLPIGGLAWVTVETEFNEWAKLGGRPERTAKSLEAKFKQFVCATKPTGDAECPPHIERAHAIEDMIGNKGETRDLDDSEIVDAEVLEISSDDEDDDDDDAPAPKRIPKVLAVKPKVKKEPEDNGPIIARRPAPADRIIPPRPRNSRNPAPDILASITSALDPAARTARDNERTTQTILQTQIITLTQQLRDASSTIENLRAQLTDSERARQAAVQQADRNERLAERNELISLFRRGSGRMLGSPSSPRLYRERRSLYNSPRMPSRYRQRSLYDSPIGSRRGPPSVRSPSPTPRRDRCARRVRQETHYPDGGRHVTWVGGDDDESDSFPRFTPSPCVRFIVDNSPSPASVRAARPSDLESSASVAGPSGVRDAESNSALNDRL